MIRHRAAGLALVLSLVVGGLACGDGGQDDGGGRDTTTTTEREGTTTVGDDATTTTLPDETTTTAAPSVAGPDDLQALLVDPVRIGEGFALDATLGNGAFSGELCEDVTLEATWADQASQAVTRGEGDDRELVTQAVLAFADEGAATAFVQVVVDGNETCLSDGEVHDVDAGDEGVLVDIVSGRTATSVAVVRAGARVTVFDALYPTDVGSSLTPELLTAAGTALGG